MDTAISFGKLSFCVLSHAVILCFKVFETLCVYTRIFRANFQTRLKKQGKSCISGAFLGLFDEGYKVLRTQV